MSKTSVSKVKNWTQQLGIPTVRCVAVRTITTLELDTGQLMLVIQMG